jgi:hypothetical protein
LEAELASPATPFQPKPSRNHVGPSVIAGPESMDEELIHQQTPQEERAQEDGS